jgi:hypothetical protein
MSSGTGAILHIELQKILADEKRALGSFAKA